MITGVILSKSGFMWEVVGDPVVQKPNLTFKTVDGVLNTISLDSVAAARRYDRPTLSYWAARKEVYE